MNERVPPGVGSNLPAEMTSFVGRRQELAEAKRLLSTTRLLTVTGPGGVGKTRLAARVADQVRRAFPGGVWFVELSALTNATLLPHTVATALGLQGSQWTRVTLAESIADKRMLIVLDNCEHLVEDCADFAAGLLASASELQVLVTSRESLKVPGEQVLPLPPLSTPSEDAWVSGTDPMHYEAVQLFVTRAAARVPGFALDADNREDIASLCGRLDGIPLAIELAADRVQAMTPKQINERLTSRLSLLTRGARGVPTRQQTLRASIDWSHGLCSEEEGHLWARLSVFSGGFELDAAEGICSGEGLPAEAIADLLSSLLDKSILLREERGSYVRYRMLGAIREYGNDQLMDAGESEQFQRRHRDWFASLVRESRDQWVGPHQPEWLDRLQSEHPNIRAALEFSLRDPDGGTPALAIATELMHYWIARGLTAEARHWLDEALARTQTPSGTRVRALCLSAYLALYVSEFEAAGRLLDEAHLALIELDDAASERAFFDLVSGSRAMFNNDLDDAMALLENAVQQFHESADLNGELFGRLVHGLAAAIHGAHEDARSSLEHCLQLTEDRSESWFRSYTLLFLGTDLWAQADNEQAETLVRDSLKLTLRLEDRLGLAWCYETLAWISCSDRHDEAAGTLLGIADAAWKYAGPSLRSFAGLLANHQNCEAELRKRLGDRTFEQLSARGAEMSSAAAQEYALGKQESGELPEGPALDFSPITAREWQIAEAVAEGLSNRQIARRYVIAQRTAEGHVEHILTKLGFNSRAQIAAWVAELRGRSKT